MFAKFSRGVPIVNSGSSRKPRSNAPIPRSSHSKTKARDKGLDADSVREKPDEIDAKLSERRDREVTHRWNILKWTLGVSVLVALPSLLYDRSEDECNRRTYPRADQMECMKN